MAALEAALAQVLALAERLFRLLAVAALATMLATNIVNILLRGLAGTAIDWVFPVSMVLFVYVAFLGYFVVVREGRDVAVDFVVVRLPRVLHLAALLGANAVVIAVLVLVLAEAPTVIEAQVGELEMVGIDRYMLSVPLFGSAALVVLQALATSLALLRGGPAAAAPARVPHG